MQNADQNGEQKWASIKTMENTIDLTDLNEKFPKF